MKQFYMRNLLIGFFFLFGFQLQAANYYWVGGAGKWSDINHWATTSGGSVKHSISPNLNDDVYFDANSGLLANSTVELPETSPAYCRNMSWVGVTAAANLIYRGQPLYVYGNLELAASVRYGTQGISFVGGGNATFKMNGAGRYPVAGWYNPLYINKPGGSVTLLDDIPGALVVTSVSLLAGDLNMSGGTHNFGTLTGGGSTPRSLDISNATLIMSNTWDYRGTNNTINTTGSSISAVLFHSDRFSFPKVDITAASSSSMVINNTTFGELTFTSTAGAANTLRIGANNTVDRLEFKSGGAIAGGGNVIKDLFIAPSNTGFAFIGNNTITGTLHANTPDCNALSQISGSGANATITFGPGAVADIQNVYMTNLAAAGSISLPISVTGADGGGNTGWTFQPRATGTTLYWVGGAGDWSDKAHWSATSGGTGGYCVPFTGDDVIFDANSGFSAGNNTITSVNDLIWCHNMTWTNVSASPVLNLVGATLHQYGSIALDPTVVVSGNITFTGTEASTFTANGFTLGTPIFRVEKTGANGGITLADDISHPNMRVFHSSGKFLLPNRTINIMQISYDATNPRTMDITNSTITLEHEWNVHAVNLTWVNNAAGSFITSKSRFITSGLTFPKVYIGGTGNSVNIANSVLEELVFTNTATAPGLIAIQPGNTIGTLDIRGAAELRGNNTINNLYLAASHNYTLRNTLNINGLFRFNSPSCNGLGELRGIAGTSPTLNFGPASTLDFDNALIENVTATGKGVPVAVSGADAGGNSGFNITSSDSGPRYWVGGSGDWNDGSHWSATSGGPGGACVPTVANDVYFDASSFTSGSSAVTISQGNAYCRNMNWAGAAFAPTFTKTATYKLEIWGSMVMNPVVTMNAAVSFLGPANATLTSNGSSLGNFDMTITKPGSSMFTITDNYANPTGRIDLTGGGLDISGRTIVAEAITDNGTANPTSINISASTINTTWNYTGANKSLQAANSTLNVGYFKANGGTYNNVDVSTAEDDYISISNTTINNLVFSNAGTASQAWLGAGNTVNYLEFKGRGAISGTGNTINTLTFAPGMTYTFLGGSNTTISNAWYGSGSPCNPTQIVSSTATNATITKTSGTVDFDYVRLNRITAAGVTPFKAGEHSTDLGGNVNWDIEPYNNSAAITGFGPDITLCATAFPHVLNTNGFFAGPSATYLWSDGSTGPTLSVNDAGTYSVTVQYPDGCSISDQIVITKSTVTVAAITGTTTVCAGLTTALQSTTAGGVWTTSDASIATVNPVTGLVTGIAAGTATITYTVTNGGGCSASQLATVTVNALPVIDAITGTLTLFEGGTTTLSSTSPGGTWFSSNTAVATVDGSGVVTGVSGGTADITYSITNANGCTATSTATVTVDGFAPAKRVLSIVKTGDAQEPSGNGGFSISLPSGVLASEDINISYTIGGTASAPADYTPLSGTAVILAGQNSVALPVTVASDILFEGPETVLVTLSGGTSTNYSYTLSSANGNASVVIADANTAADRVLTVSLVSQMNEGPFGANIRIRLPSGKRTSEDISIAYTLDGTALNGVDYTMLSGTVIMPAGQDYIDIPVNTIDDKIIEGTENLIVTLTGGTTATIGNFTPSATQGSMNVPVNDNDNTAANRTLSVTAGANAAEPAANSSFTISLPATITVSEPVTVNYTISGTAVNGTDYATIASTAVIPAGQNSVVVPVTVTDDALVESDETVILTINSGASTSFAFTASSTAGNATVTIADNDNTAANRVLSIVKTGDAAEPATSAAFRISLPTGVMASENITVTYTINGTAAAGSDYMAIPLTATIAAGTNKVDLPLTVIDNALIEGTETVIATLTAGTSANLTYTISSTDGSETINISDNDHAANSNIVVLTKVSDALEGGANGQYRISLPPGVTSSEDVVVTFSLSGLATNTTDYNVVGLVGGNIVIPAGQNSKIVEVDAGNDGIIEGPEDVVLSLTGASSASYPFTIDPSGNGAVVNIVDANAASSTPLQVIAGSQAAEPGTKGIFTVMLAGGATSAWPVTVGYTLSGTATSGVDYQIPVNIVIPVGNTSITVDLNVLDDQIIEPLETIVFTLLSGSATDGSNAYIFPPDPISSSITTNLTDNDNIPGARVLSVTKNADGAEPSTAGVYTVSLPTGYSSAADITLAYTMSGTATRDDDYSISTVELPAYQNSVTIPVSVIDDQIIEGTETMVLAMSGGTDGNSATYTVNPATSNVAMDIQDDDTDPARMLLSVVNNGNGSESGTNGGFTISLPAGVTASSDITVNYTIGGTATSGNDYDALPGTATITAGQNSINVPLVVNDDQLLENTETVILTLTGGTTGSLNYLPAGGSSSATVNITDEENSPAARTISIAAGTDAAEGTSDIGSFSISLPSGILTSEDLSVAYTVSGTALNGTDYTTLSGTAIIPAGLNRVTVSTTAMDDQIVEGGETITLSLTGATSDNFSWSISTTADQATSNITDNDHVAGNLVLAIAKVTDGSEPGSGGMFRVTLPPGITVAEDITVNYSVAGNASPGADYGVLSGSVLIPAGQGGADIPVTVLNDQILEPTETVALTLNGGSSTSFTLTGTGSASLNIADDESSMPANLALRISKTADAAEPGTNGSFTISLPAGITVAEDINVSYAITGTATPGTDYATLSGTALIPAGQGSVMLPVTVMNDPLIEATEMVTVTLNGGSSSSFSFTGTGNATVSITDEDSSTPANFVLAISGANAAEPGSNGSFTISLPAGILAPEDVTLNYTISGSATAGADYAAITGALIIPAGQNSVTVPVTVSDDQVIENTETVMLTLAGGASSSYTFSGTGSATVNITDDESSLPANLALSIANSGNASEPGTDGSIAISLPAGITTSEAITVNFSVGGTATANIDYSAITGTAVIPAGQNKVSLPVAVLDDQLLEQTETVTFTLSGGSSTSFTFSGTGNASVDIADDDNVPANLVLNVTKTLDAAEPATNGTFNIALPAGITAQADITLNYSITGTAISGQDYTPLSGVAIIPAGDNSVDLPLAITDDQQIEGTETVTIAVTGGTGAGLTFTGGSSATLDIADDDQIPENLALSIVKTADAAEPGTNGSFSISLPAGITVAEDVTVNYTVSGTATAGSDYTALSGTVTIPADQNGVVIPLVITDDAVDEAIETVTLTLTGGSSANFTFAASGTNATATAQLMDDDKTEQVITFNALPVKTFGNTAFTLDATGGASGNPVTFTSSNPAVATVSGNVVTIVGIGTAEITASQAGNAEFNAAADVTQVLTVISPNIAPTLDAITDQALCATPVGQTIALSGITAGTEPDQTVTLSVSSNNPGLFSSLTVTAATAGNASLNYTLNGGASGTALITVTVQDNGGTANGGTDTFSRSFSLEVSALPQLSITSSHGNSVSKGQILELTASGADSYTWASAAGVLSGQNSATLTVRPAQTTTYTVTGTNASGCTSTQEITITVIEDYNLVASNVITPNGDGRNDFFVVQNIDMYPNNRVRIFDRAGRVLYTKNSYNNEWDGTVNGSPLDEDTYYYIIELGNGVKAKKGFISIVRKY